MDRARIVLVVDDEADVRDLIREILQTAGIGMIPAENGQTALGLIAKRQGRIDLVLTDVMMPGLDGPALARRLGEDRPSIPVLFMTGYPRDTLAALGLLPAETPRIEKPFRIRELVDRVRDALSDS